jgi:hypothetical protein
MRVFYYQWTDFGAEPKFVKEVSSKSALEHIDLYKKTELYEELKKYNFEPQIAVSSDSKNFLNVVYEEDGTYGIFIGSIGSLQSTGYTINEVESLIDQYCSMRHVEFFFKQVHSGKHYYFVPKGAKGLYCSFLEWWYK